jgi:hypothetical protein
MCGAIVRVHVLINARSFVYTVTRAGTFSKMESKNCDFGLKPWKPSGHDSSLNRSILGNLWNVLAKYKSDYRI